MSRTSLVHYIAPSAVTIVPNANASANDLAVYFVQGAKIKVYCKKIAALDINPETNTYREWSMTGRNRRLADNSKPYTIYARLAKEDPTVGYLVFAPKYYDGEKELWLDKYPYVTHDGLATEGIAPDGHSEPSLEKYWYIRMGDVSLPEDGQRTVTFDTGILGTDQYNEDFNIDGDDLPLRVVLGCTIDDEDAGPTPWVPWDKSLVLTASLVEGWSDTDIERFDHWEITRNTGDSAADEVWNHPDEEDPAAGRVMDDGQITLSHSRGSSDDFNAAVSATFIVTAWGTPEEPVVPEDAEEPVSQEEQEEPVLVPLASASVNILAETVEKYDVELSTSIVSYNPQTQTYSPSGGVSVLVRATDQRGGAFEVTCGLLASSGMSVEYAAVDSDQWTPLAFTGEPGDVARAVIPATVFAALQQTINVRLVRLAPGSTPEQPAYNELTRKTVAFVRDGEDSRDREWIFFRSAEAVTFGTEEHPYPSAIATGTIPDPSDPGHRIASSDKNQDDWVPDGWYDDEQGISEEYPYEYGAYRDYIRGGQSSGDDEEGAHWGPFTQPKIWNRYAKDGVAYRCRWTLSGTEIVSLVAAYTGVFSGTLPLVATLMKRVGNGAEEAVIDADATITATFEGIEDAETIVVQAPRFVITDEDETMVGYLNDKTLTSIAVIFDLSDGEQFSFSIPVVREADEESVTETIEEIGAEKFLSKEHDDTAAGNITFEKNVKVGEALDVYGQATINDIKSRSYSGSGLADTGWSIMNDNGSGSSQAVFDYLTIRKKMIINSLEIKETNFSAGDVAHTLAQAEITRTDYLYIDSNGKETLLGYSQIKVPWLLRGAAMLLGKQSAMSRRILTHYKKVRLTLTADDLSLCNRVRCYFLSKDGDREVENWFRVNDLARCQTWNVVKTKRETFAPDLDDHVGNVYWWRKITDVSWNTGVQRYVAKDASGQPTDATTTNINDAYVNEGGVARLADNGTYGQPDAKHSQKTIDGNTYHWFDVAFGYDAEQAGRVNWCDFGSDIPAAGDKVVQFGNTTDPDRMNIFMIEINGADNPDAPDWKMFRGVYTFDLKNCWWGGESCCKTKWSVATGIEAYAPQFKWITEQGYARQVFVRDEKYWTEIPLERDDDTLTKSISSYPDYSDDIVDGNGNFVSRVDGKPKNYVRKCRYYDQVSHNGSAWLCSVVEHFYWRDREGNRIAGRQDGAEYVRNYTYDEPTPESNDWTEQVEKGDPGAFKSTVFCRSNSVPSTPSNDKIDGYNTFENPIPPVVSGQPEWYDGVPDGTAMVWMSTAWFYSDGTHSAWTTPRPQTDTETLDIEFSYNSTQPSAPVGTAANKDSASTKTQRHNQGWYDPNDTLPSGWTWNNMLWRAECKIKNGVYVHDSNDKPIWVISRIKGENSVRIDLSNENDSFLYTSGGSKVPSTFTVTSVASMYDGATDVSTNTTWTVTASGCTVSSGNSRNIVVTGMTAATGYVDVKGVYTDKNGVVYTRSTRLTLKKLVDVDKYDLVITPNSIAYNKTTDTPATSVISIQVWKSTVEGTRVLSAPPSGYGVYAGNTRLTASSTGIYSTTTDNSAIDSLVVKIATAASSSDYLDCETIPITKAANGASGTSPYFADIDNEMDSVACDKNGKTLTAYDATIGIGLWHGSNPIAITSLSTNSIEGFTITTSTANKNIRIQIAAGTTIAEVNTINITVAGSSSGDRYLHFVLNGVRQGENGEPAVLYSLVPSVSSVVKKKDGTYSVDNVSCTRQKNVGGTITDNTTDGTITYKLDGGNEQAYTNNTNIAVSNFTKSIQFIFRVDNKVVDIETIPMVADGKDGATPTISISSDGYWVINGDKTDVKAEGTDGKGIAMKGTCHVLYTSQKTDPSQTALEEVSANYGDCYSVLSTRHLYFYDGTTMEQGVPNGWLDMGEFQGEPGEDGKDSYMHIAYATGNPLHVTTATVDSIGFTVDSDGSQYEWMGFCTDDKEADPGRNWSSLTPAQKVAAVNAYKWNYMKGKDGNGVEYIYLLTKEGYQPTIDESRGHGSQSADEFLPAVGNYEAGMIYGNSQYWEDDPPATVSATWPVLWWANRKFKNSAWQAFGSVSLHNRYAKDGKRGDFKSTVFCRTGKNMSGHTPTGGSYDSPLPNPATVVIDGESVTWTDGIPSGSLPLWASVRTFSDSASSSWSTPRQMTDTADFDVEFSSVADPNPPSGHPNTNPQWSNASSENTIWMATSECHNGVWGDWQISKIKGEKGDSVPSYVEYQEAWSNVAVVADANTEPVPNGGWSSTTPPQGSWSYLWRRSRTMTLKADKSGYDAGQWGNYVRLSGTNGTSIEISGTVVDVKTGSTPFATTDIKNGDLAIRQGIRTLFIYDGSSWAPSSVVAADGYSYNVTKECVVDLDGDGESENVFGHLIMWSDEAAKWIDIGKFQGENGLTYFTHIAWGRDVILGTPTSERTTGQTSVPNASACAAFSPSPADGYDWMGVLVDRVAQDSTEWKYYTWKYTKGDKGDNSVRIDLDNQADLVSLDSDGKVRFARTVMVRARIYDGSAQATSGVSHNMTGESMKIGTRNAETPVLANGVVTVTWNFAKGDIVTATTKDIVLRYNNNDYTAVFSLGTTDADAIYQVMPVPSEVSFSRSAGNSLTPSSITLKCGYTKATGSSTVSVEDVTVSSAGQIMVAGAGTGMYLYSRSKTNGIWSAWNVYAAAITVSNSTTVEDYEFCITEGAMKNDFSNIVDREAVPVVKDGINGQDSMRLALDNEHEDFLYNASGVLVAPVGGATSQARLYDGPVPVSADAVSWAVDLDRSSGVPKSGGNIPTCVAGLLTVPHITGSTAKVVVKATYPLVSGNDYYAEFTANKTEGDKYDIVVKPNAISYNPADYSEQTVAISVKGVNAQGGNIDNIVISTDDTPQAGKFYVFWGYVSNNGSIGSLSNLRASSKAVSATECANYAGIYFELRRYSDGSTYRLCDYETVEIAKVQNGLPGQSVYTATAFKRNATKPAATGGDYSTGKPTESGWEDGIPSGTSPVWMAQRVLTSDGLSPQQDTWAVSLMKDIDGELDIEFSPCTSKPATPTDANRSQGRYNGDKDNIDTSTYKWFDPTLDANTVNWEKMIWMATRERVIKSNGDPDWGSWVIVKVKGESGGQTESKESWFRAEQTRLATPPALVIGQDGNPTNYYLNEDTSWSESKKFLYIAERYFLTDGSSFWDGPKFYSEWAEQGPAGDDAYTVLIEPANMIFTQSTTKDGSGGYPLVEATKSAFVTVRKGNSSDNVDHTTSISSDGAVHCSAVVNSQNQDQIDVTGILGNYTEGRVVVNVAITGGPTFQVIIGVYYNKLGDWKEEVIGDTKEEIAQSTWFDLDPVTGAIIESDRLGTFVRSSKQNLSRLDETNFINVYNGTASFPAQFTLSQETVTKYGNDYRLVMDMTSAYEDLTIDVKIGDVVKYHTTVKSYNTLDVELKGMQANTTYSITCDKTATINSIALYATTQSKYSELSQTVNGINVAVAGLGNRVTNVEVTASGLTSTVGRLTGSNRIPSPETATGSVWNSGNTRFWLPAGTYVFSAYHGVLSTDARATLELYTSETGGQPSLLQITGSSAEDTVNTKSNLTRRYLTTTLSEGKWCRVSLDAGWSYPQLEDGAAPTPFNVGRIVNDSIIKQTADNIMAQVNGLDGRVTTVEQTADSIQSTVTQLQTGKNMLSGVLTGAGWKSASSIAPSGIHDMNTVDDYWLCRNDGDTYIVSPSFSISKDKEYTISFDVSGTGNPRVYVVYDNGGTFVTLANPIASGSDRRSATFTADADRTVLLFVSRNMIRYPQVELGDTPTEFSADSVEMSSQITQTADNIQLFVTDGLNKTGIDITNGNIDIVAGKVTFSYYDNGTKKSDKISINAATGTLKAVDVDLTGKITATSGSITGQMNIASGGSIIVGKEDSYRIKIAQSSNRGYITMLDGDSNNIILINYDTGKNAGQIKVSEADAQHERYTFINPYSMESIYNYKNASSQWNGDYSHITTQVGRRMAETEYHDLYVSGGSGTIRHIKIGLGTTGSGSSEQSVVNLRAYNDNQQSAWPVCSLDPNGANWMDKGHVHVMTMAELKVLLDNPNYTYSNHLANYAVMLTRINGT